MRPTRPYLSPLVLLSLILGLAVLAPANGAAQDAERDRDNCICFGEGDANRVHTWTRANRARIGVFLDHAEEVDGHLGIRVAEVEADGPARQAGLRDGDVITAVDGAPLGDPPGRGLVRAIRDVEPGDTVELTYYRDGRRRTAEVVTDEADVFGVVSPQGYELRIAPRVGELRNRLSELNLATPGAFLRRVSPAGLGLVELNPALGEYFGTEDGVLVTEVHDDALGLEPGDIILAVGDRDVRDPAHVRAILDSYRPDEEITFRVVRHERERTVTGTLRD